MQKNKIKKNAGNKQKHEINNSKAIYIIAYLLDRLTSINKRKNIN